MDFYNSALPSSSHANEGVSTLASLPDDPVANADTDTHYS